MQMIQLNEAYYRNGCYQSKPLLLNAEDISAVNEDNSGYEDFVIVHMKNGAKFRVKDTYKHVIDSIMGVK